MRVSTLECPEGNQNADAINAALARRQDYMVQTYKVIQEGYWPLLTRLELSRGWRYMGAEAGTALGELLLSGSVPNIQILDLTSMVREESFHLLETIRHGELPNIRQLHIDNEDVRDGMFFMYPDANDRHSMGFHDSEPTCDVIAEILRRCVCPQLETLTIKRKSDETFMGGYYGSHSDLGMSRILQGLVESSGRYSNLKELVLTEDFRATTLGRLSSSSFSRALSSGNLDHLTKLRLPFHLVLTMMMMMMMMMMTMMMKRRMAVTVVKICILLKTQCQRLRVG